jgi:hypothetical protein
VGSAAAEPDLTGRDNAAAPFASSVHGVEALVMSVKEQQHSLLSAWQGDDAGAEEQRTTIRQYRAFWSPSRGFLP